jgi:cysteinyl-tRNA synthetase
MKIYNTLARQIEEVRPLDGGRVRMYTCGPTVYNFAHIGNFRAYLFEDLLRRALQFAGFEVTQVMNLTDVDDKTIRGARAAGVSLDEFTRPFKEAFFADLARLGVEPAEHYPAATAHIPEMVALIGRLLASGHAYRSDDGSVYYNVARFPAYGRLAHLDVVGLRAGARVEQDEYDKENMADFALWKAWDPEDGDVAWDAPWGRGRPGWHIECSAMSMKYLGESFDIHTGGADNIFPHHENEIAQSEAATGRPYVRIWAHCGYLLVDNAKMSKSLGNFYTLRDLLGRGYSGREVRYALLAGHYRQPLNFTFDALGAARSALARLDEFTARLSAAAGRELRAGKPPAWAAEPAAAFRAAIENDLGMPDALGALFQMAHAGHRECDGGRVGPRDALAVLDLLAGLDRVLGFLVRPEDAPPPEVLELNRRRDAARAAKNWPESDALRAQLAAAGWEARDTPAGSVLRRARV